VFLAAAGIGFLLTMATARRPKDEGFSDYFTDDDLTASEHAEDINFLEQFQAPEYAYVNAEYLARTVLDPMYEYLESKYGGDFIINSWWRHPVINAAVGGSETSLHLQALAVDPEYFLDGQQRNDLLIEAFVAVNPPFHQFIVYGRSTDPDHIHLAADPDNNKGEVLHSPRDGDYDVQNLAWLASL